LIIGSKKGGKKEFTKVRCENDRKIKISCRETTYTENSKKRKKKNKKNKKKKKKVTHEKFLHYAGPEEGMKEKNCFVLKTRDPR